MLDEKMKRLRTERGITQKELARRLGVSPSTVGMYEQGRRIPDSRTLKRIASALDCSADELLSTDRSADVSEVIDGFARTLERQPGLMFNGAPITRSDREKLANAIRIAAAITSREN